MFIISLILLSIFILMLFFINDKIKDDLESVQTENKILKDKIWNLNSTITKISRIYKSNSTSKVLDEDIKEAIKYAMKKSHPDNNGNAEDFNKFRKLYERIK